MGGGGSIGDRKAQHLEICVEEEQYAVEGGSTMLDHVRLVHTALPEIAESDVDTSTKFLNLPISMPVFISSMTGGSAEGYRMNKLLARVAQEAGIPVGMGSIRILFRKPDVIDHFQLKKHAPDVPVFANIGGVQLRDSSGIDPLVELVKQLEVDGIAVHLNPGQELAQPEGDRDFDGVLAGIAKLCAKCPVPVIAKETGFGIHPQDAGRLIDAGVMYVDVAGSGGTNWVSVEGYRLDPDDRGLARELANWGIPTAVAVAAASGHEGRILASGGLRSGLDVARSIALGARAAGLALPFAREISRGGLEAGLRFAEHLRTTLAAIMLLTGSRTVGDLQKARKMTTLEFDHAVAQVSGTATR